MHQRHVHADVDSWEGYGANLARLWERLGVDERRRTRPRMSIADKGNGRQQNAASYQGVEVLYSRIVMYDAQRREPMGVPSQAAIAASPLRLLPGL